MKWILLYMLSFSALCFSSSQPSSFDTEMALQNSGNTPPQNTPTTQPPAETSEETPSYQAAFLRTLLVLIGILVVVFVAFWIFKRGSLTRIYQNNHLRNIKVLEKRALSPKTILYLVEVGGKQILIGESQLELRNLSDLDWIEPPKQGL